MDEISILFLLKKKKKNLYFYCLTNHKLMQYMKKFEKRNLCGKYVTKIQ